MAHTFRGTLREEAGTFVEVPPDVLAALGPRKRPAVRVVINGVELRTTIAVYGGRSYIGIRREIRDAAHIAPGEEIEVSVEPDDQPRTVDLPDDLARLLPMTPTPSTPSTDCHFRTATSTWPGSSPRNSRLPAGGVSPRHPSCSRADAARLAADG